MVKNNIKKIEKEIVNVFFVSFEFGGFLIKTNKITIVQNRNNIAQPEIRA